MNFIELPKLDKLVKVSIHLLEPTSRLRPYVKDRDVACIVIPMGSYVSYPEQVIQGGMNLWRLSWLEKPFGR